MTRTIQVWGDWGDDSAPFLIGSMFVDSVRGKESLAFAFDKGWLQSPAALTLDPHLQLFGGYQYPPIGEQSSFGFLLDSSPDRWGRMLMQRREAQRARTERRRPRSLMDSDYLLGVHDEQRMGAMRYRLSADGTFLSAEVELAAPPWKSLRELEQAAWIIQNQTTVDEDLEELWRRIVFSILIHNTDDHLRNHGFLLTDNGWRLSPAYDLNPDPHGMGLSLNISELDNSLNIDLAYDVAPHFRVSSSKADAIVAMARDAVSDWKQVAADIGISRREQELMSHAFQVK